MAGVEKANITAVGDGFREEKEDLLVTEEPLELRLYHDKGTNAQATNLAVTMRTPGHDLELALGFLFTEGIIQRYSDVANIRHCEDKVEKHPENIVKIFLQPEVEYDVEKAQRNFYTTSSCGICGKASIEAIQQQNCKPVQDNDLTFTADFIHSLSKRILKEQTLFEHTGGLHATGLFSETGELLLLREDIGRHNAFDKVIGAQVFQNNVPLSKSVIFLSGRAGFELVQKCAMAGVPVMVAVGAPSSLAVQTAKAFNLTLIGFARNGKFNIYSHPHRIA